MTGITVQLTPEDERVASEVGRIRNDRGNGAGWTDHVVANGFDGAAAHDLGARAELAFRRAFGLAEDWADVNRDSGVWREAIRVSSEINAPDVAGVDIRATTYPNGRLLLKVKDPPNRAHVLVISPGEGLYRVVGWVWGHMGKVPEFWDDSFRTPCWAVPQSRLLDPRWLELDRGAG